MRSKRAYWELGFIILALIVGFSVCYYYFPQEIEVKKIIYKDKIVVKTVEVCSKDCCPNIPACNSQIRQNKPNTAYIIENGDVSVAGTKYSNSQSECARLHDITKC